MKAPLVVTALLLAIGIGWSVREERVLAGLREQHRLVMLEAAALGVSNNPGAAEGRGVREKRQREDSHRRTKEFALSLVAFAKEMEQAEKAGNREDANMQHRAMEMLDQLLSLKSEELGILIAEVRASNDLSDDMRSALIGFSIISLSQDHPEKALQLFAESSDMLADNGMGKHVLSSTLAEWAKDQPFAAVEWMKRNEAKFPDLINDDARKSVVAGAASKDFGLAFELVEKLGLSANDSMLSAIAETAGTLDRQKELMSVIRGKAAGMSDPAKAAEFVQIGASSLFSQVSLSGYDAAMDWLKSANLNERVPLGIVVDIQYHRIKQDTGKWLEWIGSGEDSNVTRDVTRNLVRDWTRNDYKAAGEWLASAPAGSNRDAAVSSYAETVAPYDADVAAQWADTLSADKRMEALKRIQATIRAKDEAAADDFGKRYGLPLD